MSDSVEKKETLKPLEVNFDQILKEVGSFGKYQIRCFVLLIIPVILTSTHANNYIFSAQAAKYRCKNACDGPGVEFEPQWLENAAPLNDKCLKYTYLNNTSYGKVDNSSCPSDWFDKSKTVPCDGYVFAEEDTFVEEIGIACEEWKRTLIGTIHSLGTLVALPIIGYVSDRFGRKVTLALSGVVEGILGIVKALSVNYAMFLAFEFLEPALGSGVYTAAYVLALEILAPKSRAAAGMVINIYFGLGQAVMGGLSYASPYWRSFLYSSYIPSLFLFVYYWLLDESNRWLLSKGRYQDVIKNAEKIAKTNGKEPSPETMEPLHYNAKHESEFNTVTEDPKTKPPNAYYLVIKSRILVLRLLKCSFWWITCVFCFYGLSINSVALAGSLHLNFVLSAFVEIPAHFLGLFGMNYIGRKWTIFIAFIIGGVSCFSFAFTPEDPDLQWISMTAYLIGKLFVTLAFGSIYLYTSELFPTNLRHSLLAFCSMIGRVGSILAPQTPLLSEYMEALPSILFGSTCIISALLMLPSPETLHLRLPETIEEAENLSSLVIDKNKDEKP